MFDRVKIEQIVREVIAKLSIEEDTQQMDGKRNLLVVGDITFLESQQLEQLQKNWNIIHYNQERKVPLDQVIHVLFLHATQDLLVKGALGLFDTPESKLLSRCLLESVQVSIIPTVYLQKHLFSENPRNKVYLSQLQRYKETLMQFGAKVETLEEFIKKDHRKQDSILEKAPKDMKKKVITRRDVQDCTGSYLEIDSNTIVTPLARDTARELGIDIKELDSKGAKR